MKEIYNETNCFEKMFNIYSIPIKILNKNAKIPTKGSEKAAGWDLYAAIENPIDILPYSTRKIGTGLSFELPDGTFMGIFPRSGIATKRGLRPANCVGVCDSDYRGEYIVALHNDTNEVQTIEPGERIAQMILLPYLAMSFYEVDNLSDTTRGNSGFGDSGKF